MSTPPVDFDVELPLGTPYALVSCVLKERTSVLTEAKVEIRVPMAIQPTALLREKVGVTILLFGAEARRWSLVVTGIEAMGTEGDTFRYVVDLHAYPYLQLLTRNTRKFMKRTAHEIIAQVLGEGGVPFVFKTVRPTPRRNFCTQYRESNWTFVSRLLQFEGIYYSFEEDGTLVMEDRSSAASPVDGDPHVELLEAAGFMSRAKLGVHEISRGARVQSGTATVNDYNWKTPDVKLIKSASADHDQNLEIYDYPVGYRNEADGEFLAQIRLEALRVGADYLRGKGDVVTFQPMRTFDFGGAAGGDFAGEYLLLAVEHRLKKVQPDQKAGLVEDTVTYENSFDAMPRAQAFRPAVTIERPTILGNHTVMVRGPIGEEIHTDDKARFKAQFHWDREAKGTDEDSRWLRMLQECGSSQFLARIGWEMNVAYVDGDPDRPMGLARNVNGVMTPTYSQPASKNVMTIKTPSSPATGGFNEIKLDDSAASQLFYIQAEKDLNNVVKNDRLEQVGRDEKHFVKNSRTHNVQRDQTYDVGGNQSRTVAKAHLASVKLNRTWTVGGNEDTTTGGAYSLAVAKNDTESVGSVKLTVVGIPSLPTAEDLKGQVMGKLESVAKGAVQAGVKALFDGGGIGGAASAMGSSLSGAADGMKASLSNLTPASVGQSVMDMLGGTLSREAEHFMLRMVGGAYITVGIGNVMTSMNGYLEMVGGVHLTVTADNAIQDAVVGPLSTTVGGAILKMSDSNMGIGAHMTKVMVGGLAMWSSDKELKIESGDAIVFEAQTQLEFACGGATISLTPGKVSIKGEVEVAADGKVEFAGSVDNVTA